MRTPLSRKRRLHRLAESITRWRPRRMHELAHDTDAAIAPMVAVLGMSLILAAGLALDVTLYIAGNRDLRSATEAAALAAAQNPADAQNRAITYLTRQGYNASVVESVQVGHYCANNDPDQRFQPDGCAGESRFGNSDVDAVRITTSMPSRRFLTGVLGSSNPIPDLAATATAARIDEAGIGITSDILSKVVSPLLDPVTDPLVITVNKLLTSLLGTPISLGKNDVKALMQGNVDAGVFFDKLAELENFTGTYGELMNAQHGIKDIATAAADAADYAGNTNAANALRLFAGQVSNTYKVPFTSLFGLGVWKNMPVGEAEAKPALRAGMNAYQLLTYAVQAGPTTIDLSDAVNLLVPVANASVLKIGLVSSSDDGRPRYSFGPAGDVTAYNSALRVLIQIDLPVVVPLVASVNVHLPIVLDVAAAQATVTGIICNGTNDQANNTTVAVQATSSVVNGYIGDTSVATMTKTLPPIGANDFQQATIANVSLLAGLVSAVDVKGRVIARPVTGGAPQSASMTFGPVIGGPGVPGAPQQIGNEVAIGQTVSGLVTGLLRSDGLEIKVLNLCLPIVCSAAQSTVRNTVLPALVTPVTNLVGTVVDPLLNNVLSALGVQLGSATIWATGARCGVPVLV